LGLTEGDRGQARSRIGCGVVLDGGCVLRSCMQRLACVLSSGGLAATMKLASATAGPRNKQGLGKLEKKERVTTEQREGREGGGIRLQPSPPTVQCR
jgi:hypothetical protein